MMATLAGLLAARQIETPFEAYWTDVEGDIEVVNGEALAVYLDRCSVAQSVIGCIDILDNLVIEGLS